MDTIHDSESRSQDSGHCRGSGKCVKRASESHRGLKSNYMTSLLAHWRQDYVDFIGTFEYVAHWTSPISAVNYMLGLTLEVSISIFIKINYKVLSDTKKDIHIKSVQNCITVRR